MQALGLIETKGLIAATESADAMLKAADVSLLEKTYVGGGLVYIAITGDVGAVKAAVEAGAGAVIKMNEKLLISQHIIPRPHEELNSIIGTTKIEPEEVVVEEIKIEPIVEELIEEVEEISIEPGVESIEEAKEEIEIEPVIEKSNKEVETIETIESSKEASDYIQIGFDENYNKEVIDKIILENGLEKTIEIISKFKVAQLRNLAREYTHFGIPGNKISKTDKKVLIAEFKKYYENNQLS